MIKLGEKEEENGHCKAAKGQVDPKAPPPGQFSCENATKNGSKNSCDSKHHGDGGYADGTYAEREDVADDNVSTSCDSCRTHARDGTAGDEGITAGRQSTDQRSKLEDEDSCEQGIFHGEVGVETAEE